MAERGSALRLAFVNIDVLPPLQSAMAPGPAQGPAQGLPDFATKNHRSHKMAEVQRRRVRQLPAAWLRQEVAAGVNRQLRSPTHYANEQACTSREAPTAPPLVFGNTPRSRCAAKLTHRFSRVLRKQMGSMQLAEVRISNQTPANQRITPRPLYSRGEGVGG